MDVLSVYLGVRLGLYRALADRGASSSEELAAAAGLNERYVREWLEQQATTGILEVDDERRFTLPPGHDEALLDETSLNYVAPFGKLLVACVRPIDELLEAFRSGDGVPYADYGADLHEGQAEFTRPIFEQLLGSEWFPRIPGRPRAAPGGSSRARRGRRLRPGLVDDGDRPRVSEGPGRRNRPRPGLDRGCARRTSRAAGSRTA